MMKTNYLAIFLYVATFIFICHAFNGVFSVDEKTEDNILGIGFVILSQNNKYHEKLAETLEVNIIKQTTKLKPNVHLKIFKSSRNFDNVAGDWIIWPLFKRLANIKNLKWVFFLEDHTQVDVPKVVQIVSSYNPTQNVFAGYSLKDVDPTIIHHFASTDDVSVITYPHFSAGFFLSFSFIKKLVNGKCENCYFSTDPKYELAEYIWDNSGVRLIHEPRLCLLKHSQTCATWINKDFSRCGPPIPSKRISVAVKTCKKFHKDRLKVLLNTWGSGVENLLMFSDTEDKTIPTIKVNVKNVASGHCEKTLSIMKFFIENKVSFKWLVIADDDTLIGFYRLRRLLTCYNPAEDVVLGERYGYSIWGKSGYSYPTGGSGMIFSKSAVKKLISTCKCPSLDSPDDMIIGACLKSLNIDVTHVHFLHQARPVDYSPKFLAPFRHISFHRHGIVDPYSVYREWLKESEQSSIVHSEL